MEAQKKIEFINIKKSDNTASNDDNKEEKSSKFDFVKKNSDTIEDINNFNISFFLPKDVYENINEDKTEKNNIEPNNVGFEPNQNNSINLKDNNVDKFPNTIQGKKYDIKGILDINNDKLNINFNNNNQQQKIQHPFYFNNNNNNNNFFIPNVNERPINYNFNNTFNINYSSNIISPINYPNFPNYSFCTNPYVQSPKTSNSQINMNSLANKNKKNYDSYKFNTYYNKTRNQSNNKLNEKKIKDEYTMEMFGRWGWICKLCNNFNYDTRKKCNRCHENKNPKKIKEYLDSKKNKEINHRQFWFCIYCGNYNYAFRLICNRCKRQKYI